jgi:mono/diheme cytochrome c family protein
MKICSLFILPILFLCACGQGEKSAPKIEVSSTADNLKLFKIGEGIFKTNCAMCHSTDPVNPNLNAPLLDSVKYHWPDEDKLGAYIRNAKENLNQDEYTTALYEKYKSKLQMPPYRGLTDEELQGIILYIYSFSK